MKCIREIIRPCREEAKLHVLALDCTPRVVGVAVHAEFIFQLLVDLWQALAFDKQLQRLAAIQVVHEFAMGANAGESEAVDEALFPQPPQAPLGYVFVAANQAHQFRSRREAVT